MNLVFGVTWWANGAQSNILNLKTVTNTWSFLKRMIPYEELIQINENLGRLVMFLYEEFKILRENQAYLIESDLKAHTDIYKTRITPYKKFDELRQEWGHFMEYFHKKAYSEKKTKDEEKKPLKAIEL